MKPALPLSIACLTAAVAAVALYYSQRGKAELAAQVTRLSRQNADLRFELKQASQMAAEVDRRAVELDSQLGSTKARTTAIETRSTQLTRELKDVKAQLTDREQREVALMAELAELRQRVAAGFGAESPAPKSPMPSVTPAIDLTFLRSRITHLEEQLTALLTRALEEPLVPPAPAAQALPEPHQVVRVGPGDAFVVLDYGAEHGARLHTLIRLHRGTSMLAQVQISDVRPRFSLAQIVPGSLKGQLQTGDLVVFNP